MTTPLTAERLAALKVLLDAMPAAPWRVALSQPSPGIRTAAGWEVVHASYDDHLTVLEFIAAARNELPALLADNEWYRENLLKVCDQRNGYSLRLDAAETEVIRLTALITAPDGGGIPLPLLDELQSIAVESGCEHRAAIAVAAETAYSVGSEHAEDLRAEVLRRGEANTLLATLNSEAHAQLRDSQDAAKVYRKNWDAARNGNNLLLEQITALEARRDAALTLCATTPDVELDALPWAVRNALIGTPAAVPAAPVPAPADEVDGATEWAARVDQRHPVRREVEGDYIRLPEETARHAPQIWPGWTTVCRSIGPWREPDAVPAPVEYLSVDGLPYRLVNPGGTYRRMTAQPEPFRIDQPLYRVDPVGISITRDLALRMAAGLPADEPTPEQRARFDAAPDAVPAAADGPVA